MYVVKHLNSNMSNWKQSPLGEFSLVDFSLCFSEETENWLKRGCRGLSIFTKRHKYNGLDWAPKNAKYLSSNSKLSILATTKKIIFERHRLNENYFLIRFQFRTKKHFLYSSLARASASSKMFWKNWNGFEVLEDTKNYKIDSLLRQSVNCMANLIEHFTIVNYDSRVVSISNLRVIMTLES